MTLYTNADKAKCATREAAMRRSVYPKRVAEGRMSREIALREIAIMSEIAEDYRKAAAQDEAHRTDRSGL